MATVANSKIIDKRFFNTIKTYEVCLVNQLNLLVIPHAKKIDIHVNSDIYSLIAEEALDFDSVSAQEELFHKYSTELNEAVRQLAILIAKVGFNDVDLRNLRVLKEPKEFFGKKRIVLFDLEHLQSAINGFVGDPNGSCGLIGCVSEKQIDIS